MPSRALYSTHQCELIVGRRVPRERLLVRLQYILNEFHLLWQQLVDSDGRRATVALGAATFVAVVPHSCNERPWSVKEDGHGDGEDHHRLTMTSTRTDRETTRHGHNDGRDTDIMTDEIRIYLRTWHGHNYGCDTDIKTNVTRT